MANENNSIDLETQEMLHAFVSEAFDSLDTNEPIVEDLRNGNNSESVNAIFRVFHTLKGLSGFFAMKIIHKVTHEAETLLDVMRRQNSSQSEDTLTVIYQSFDFLRSVLQRVSTEFTDVSAEEEANDLILIIRDCLDSLKGMSDDIISTKSEQKPVEVKPEPKPEPIPIFEPIPPSEEVAAVSEKPESAPSNVTDNLITDEMLDQYMTNAVELVDNTEKNLLELEKSPKNEQLVQTTFGAVHSLKGNSGFMGFSEIEELSAEMETILDSIRTKALDVEQVVITVLLSNVEIIRNRLNEIAKNSMNKQDNKPEAASPTKPVEEKKLVLEPAKSVVAEEVKPAPIQNVEIHKPIEKKPEKHDPPTTPTPLPQMQKKDIRVETIKIDKLFNLVGELITIETMVTKNPDLAGLELPNFLKSASMLNKITRDLQEISMSIRMMPLEGLFNKMKRLVRDVSIKMQKKVNLIIAGQETEMDKNVIDEISDPLVHILRNAIDHGVESPEKRLAKGKSDEGTVSLAASYEGNEILITVEDDGAGLNKDVLIKKAQERGLLKVAPETMTDNEIFNLIFEPGFSTAQKVTDISGRGVGMDVVRKNIEKLHGSVDIKSAVDKGSKFTLRIPLTLAIMESMVIRYGTSIYALPILSLRESFKPKPETITVTMDGLEVVRVRQEILPIIRLNEIFSGETHTKDLTEGILIILESREKKVCLYADEIVGQQQAVIKTLSDYIGKVPGITGCMILGDGGIGLILDIESLIEMSEKPLKLVI